MPPKGRTTRNSNVDSIAAVKREEFKVDVPEKEDEEPFPEIDAFELECRLNARVHQVLSSEEQFQSGLGYLKQLAQKKLEVQEGTSEDLNDRIKEQVNEKNRRLVKIDEWYNLQFTRMQRRVDATKECALTSRLANIVNTQEKLLETLSNKEKAIISTLVTAKKVAQLTKRAMAGKDVDEECETRTKNIKLSYSKIDRYRQSLKYPVIVYQLTDKQIAEDLAFFEDALAQKNLERELEKSKNLEALANMNKDAIVKYSVAPKKSRKIPIEDQKCVKILKIKIKKKKRDGLLKKKKPEVRNEGTASVVKKPVLKKKKVFSSASTSKDPKATSSTSKDSGSEQKPIKKARKTLKRKKSLLATTRVSKLPCSSTTTEAKVVLVSAPSTSAETKEEPVTSTAKKDLISS